MERRIGPKDAQNLRIVESSPAGKKMLDRTRSINAKIIYARSVLMFREFIGKDFESIVAEYRADLEKNQLQAFEKWEEILDDYGRTRR